MSISCASQGQALGQLQFPHSYITGLSLGGSQSISTTPSLRTKFLTITLNSEIFEGNTGGKQHTGHHFSKAKLEVGGFAERSQVLVSENPGKVFCIRWFRWLFCATSRPPNCSTLAGTLGSRCCPENGLRKTGFKYIQQPQTGGEQNEDKAGARGRRRQGLLGHEGSAHLKRSGNFRAQLKGSQLNSILVVNPEGQMQARPKRTMYGGG